MTDVFPLLSILKADQLWLETNEQKSGDECKGGQVASEALSGLNLQREEGLVRLAPVQ